MRKYLEKSYFADTSNIHIEKLDFYKGVNEFFTYSGSETRTHEKVAEDFGIITTALLTLKNHDQEEAFFKVTKNFINVYNNNIGYQSKTGIAVTHSFLNMLKNEQLAPLTAKMYQNIPLQDIFKVIVAVLARDNVTLMRDMTNTLIPEKEKELHYLGGLHLIANLIKNDNRSMLNYLLNDYNGWNQKDMAVIMLGRAQLDDSLLELLFKKIPKINEVQADQLSEFISRQDVPNLRKLEIINNYFECESYSALLHPFINSIIRDDNFEIKNLFDHYPNVMKLYNEQSFYEKMTVINMNETSTLSHSKIHKHLKDPEIIKKAFTKGMLSPKNISEVYNDYRSRYNDEVRNFVKSGFNNLSNKEKIDVLVNFLNEKENEATVFYATIFHKMIDETEEHSVVIQQKKYNNLGEYLIAVEEPNFLYKKFMDTKNANDKKALCNQLLKNTPTMTDYQLANLYKAARTQCANHNDFFNQYIIQNRFMHNQNYKMQFVQFFVAEKNELVFNLPDENPIHQYIEHNMGPNIYNGGYDFEIIKKLQTYFNFKLADSYNSNGKSVIDMFDSKQVPGNFLNELKALFKEDTSKKSWYKFWDQEEQAPRALQLVIDHNSKKFIYNESDMVATIGGNVEVAVSKSFSSLFNQAESDLNKFQSLLEKNSNKPIHLEVKIRGENLLLNNLNFLQQVKDSVDDFNHEDQYFFKNNLGRYLLQCTESYIHSVNRNQTLSNSQLKKGEGEIEAMKEKIDKEALRQIDLLEKELELVKSNIINRIQSDMLRHMKVNTKVLEAHLEDTSSRTVNIEEKVISIKRAP